MDWKRRDYSLSSRPGFLLAEALVVLLILSLSAALAAPSLFWWQEERELDIAAETLAAAIREAEILAKDDGERDCFFYCLPDSDGTVYYYTRRGTTRIKPTGRLPSSIRLSGNLELAFKKTYAGKGETYSAYLLTKDYRYRRQVTVAMYTGRVRVIYR